MSTPARADSGSGGPEFLGGRLGRAGNRADSRRSLNCAGLYAGHMAHFPARASFLFTVKMQHGVLLRRESPEPFRYRRQSGFPSHSRYGDPYCRAAVPPQRGYAAQIGKWRRLLPSSGPNYAHTRGKFIGEQRAVLQHEEFKPQHTDIVQRVQQFFGGCARGFLPSVR